MKIKYTYWQEADGKFLGHLNELPDHWTQGETLEELQAHLHDLWNEFMKDKSFGVRREGELEVS